MNELGGIPRIFKPKEGPTPSEIRDAQSHRSGQELARVVTEGGYVVSFVSALAFLAHIYSETKTTPQPTQERAPIAGPQVAGEQVKKADVLPEISVPEVAERVPPPIEQVTTPVVEDTQFIQLVGESEQVLRALKTVGGTLRQQSPALQKGASATTLCTFADTWYEKQKSELNTLWTYVGEKKEYWGADMHAAMKTGYEIALKASKKEKAPKSPADFEAKLGDALAKPANTETNCGKLFSLAVAGLKGFSMLGGTDYIGAGQAMAEQTLVGSIEVIRKDIAEAILEKDKDRLVRATAMAGILGKLVETAKK